MIKVLVIMTLGILLGVALREKKTITKFLGKSTLWIIFTLLFFMGVSVGTNKEIMQNLDSIGLQGLLLSITSILGSIILAWVVYNLFFKQIKEHQN